LDQRKKEKSVESRMRGENSPGHGSFSREVAERRLKRSDRNLDDKRWSHYSGFATETVAYLGIGEKGGGEKNYINLGGRRARFGGTA